MSLISRTGWTMWRRKTFPNIWENVKNIKRRRKTCPNIWENVKKIEIWGRKTFPNFWEIVKNRNLKEKNISKHLRKCKKFWQLGGCYIGVTKVYVLPFRHLILCFLSNGGLDVFSSSHHFSTLCPVFISYLVPLFRASIGSEWYTMFTMITLQPNERITSLDKGTREWNDNIVTQRHHNTMTWWQDGMIIWWHDNTMTRCHFRSSEAESKQPLLSCWLP